MAILPIKTNPYYFADLVDFSQRSFWVAAGSIIFNPVFWNSVAQNEYRHKTITKLLGNRPYYGCYLLGASIFLLGILRDHLYNQALIKQPINGYLALPFVKYFGGLLIVAGQILVLSSMYALGVTGTYLGDYFGILMPHIVTGFPFNVVSDPMYFGSSLSFIGVALWFAKPAGLILSVLLSVVYVIALKFESPFTAEIYKKAASATASSSSTTKTAPKKRTSNATSRRSSSGSTATVKRSASTSSRRGSTAGKAKKDTASATASSTTSSAAATPAKKAATPRRKKSTSNLASAATSDAETTTPAKRGRKKKTAA